MVIADMLIATDTSKGLIEFSKFQLPLEKLVIKMNGELKLELIDWEKAGLRIDASIQGLGRGYFNDKPYTDIKKAIDEYKRVVEQVKQGHYYIELYGDNKLRLILSRLILSNI